MSEPRRRMPPKDGEAQRQIARQARAARGQTKWTRDVPQVRVYQIGNLYAEVFHGDDGTVLRPPVSKVQWVGAAQPENGLSLDFWYPVTVSEADV